MNATNNVTSQSETDTVKNKLRFKKVRWALLVLLILAAACAVGMYWYNNTSLMGDEEFARRLDLALERATDWYKRERNNIIQGGNIALVKMIQDANLICANPEFSSLVDEFMSAPTRPDCWKTMLDPKRPVNYSEINRVLSKENY